jgi:hypothetical protein
MKLRLSGFNILVALLRLVAFFAFLAFPGLDADGAQQLGFPNLLPSSELLGMSPGVLRVNVLKSDGSMASNSSARITVAISGPDGFFISQTNNATNGTADFDFSGVTFNRAGFYAVSAMSSGLGPAFQNVGVETTMLPPQGTMFAGARVSPSTGPMNIAALELACGRTLALSMHYYAWTDSAFASPTVFTNGLKDDMANNRIPVVSWNSTNLTEIISSNQDIAISNAANAMAAFQGPILLRWAWEMNLAGHSDKAWAYLEYPTNGTDPSPAQVAAAQTNFVSAWQRIRKIFDANGAANVIWLWNPGAGNDSAPGNPATGYTDGFYPGDNFVDWIGLDAYNRQNDAFVNTFTTDPAYGYTNMVAHAKPLLIGETGAYFTNEAHQITYFDAGAGALATNLPELLGYMYFDANGNDDWSLTIAGVTNGLTEFSNLVKSPYLSAVIPQFLSYSQFHSFNARVHLASPFTTLQGGSFNIGVSVDNLYSNTPTGTVAIYSDTNYLATVRLAGSSGGYCQMHALVTITNAGTHSLEAIYSGDANNSPGQSWPVVLDVLAPPLNFQNVQLTGGNVKLVWNAVSNQTYQVQFSSNLTKVSWNNLGNAFLATNITASATDSIGVPAKFYRITTSP